MSSKKFKNVSYLKPAGLYQARYMITLPNGIRKRQAVYGKTPEEAQEKRNKALAKAIMGNPLKTSNLTVGEYLNTWVGTRKRIRESTRAGYAGEIRKYINPNIGKIKLSSLSGEQVQYMLDKIVNEGASLRTAHIVKTILSKALKKAVSRNMAMPGIMKDIELDAYEPKERVVWSEEEGRAFLEATKGHKYYFLFLLYMTYGLRRGEAIPLTWDDIDLDNKTIRVNKQYTYHGRELVICPPKTKKSTRYLPILPPIEIELRNLMESQNLAGSNKLLVSNDGELVKPSSIEYEFKKIVKKHNLPEVVLHSQRHFVATMLKEAGVTVKEAQEILGHSSPVTTMQFYQHSNMESKTKALAKYAEKMQF